MNGVDYGHLYLEASMRSRSLPYHQHGRRGSSFMIPSLFGIVPRTVFLNVPASRVWVILSESISSIIHVKAISVLLRLASLFPPFMQYTSIKAPYSDFFGQNGSLPVGSHTPST